jgi:hypothetical protein
MNAKPKLAVVSSGTVTDASSRFRPCWFPADDAGDCIEPGCKFPKRAEAGCVLHLCGDPAHRLSHGKRLPPIGYVEAKPVPASQTIAPPDLLHALAPEAALVAEIAAKLASGRPATAEERARLRQAANRFIAAQRLLDGKP